MFLDMIFPRWQGGGVISTGRVDRALIQSALPSSDRDSVAFTESVVVRGETSASQSLTWRLILLECSFIAHFTGSTNIVGELGFTCLLCSLQSIHGITASW